MGPSRDDELALNMSMSLRDQLLQAGLISKKQADEAERQNQRRERRPAGKSSPKQEVRRASAPRPAAPPRPTAPSTDLAAKAARRARAAQIKQLIERSRLPPIESEDLYHFVIDSKVRGIAVNPATRARLIGGEISVVRHDGAFHLIPTALAGKFLELGVHMITSSPGVAPH